MKIKEFLKIKWLTPKRALLLVIVFFGFLLITQGEPYVRSDGFCYYTIDKSLIDQHSFVSSTQPEYWNYMGHVKETFDGNYISVCSPGAAIINLPALTIANLAKGDKNINNDYFIAYNGHSLYEGIAYLITAMVVGLAALILIFKTLRLLKISEKIAMFSTASVFVSSYALWYIFLYPSYTHIYEIFSLSLIFYGFIRYLNLKEDKYALFITGAGIGLSVLTRPVLIPFGIIILLYLLYKRNFKDLFKTGLGGLPFALIYFAYNFISYGRLITSGYGDVRGENFQFNEFHGLDVLFSAYRGLFIYTPVLLLSIVGLIFLWRRSRILTILSILPIVVIACIYGLWPAWWGGGSYGSRFMMFVVPIGCIGLATLLKWIKDLNESSLKLTKTVKILVFRIRTNIFKIVTIISIILTIYSSSILLFYRVTPVGSGFYTPLHFFKTQVEYLKDSGSTINYFKNLPSHIQDGSGILALLTGVSDYVVTIRPTDISETNNPDGANISNTAKVNRITIKMFAPPYSTQPLPEEITFYIIDIKNQKIYSAKITDLSSDIQINLICTTRCSSQSNNFRITDNITDIKTLPVNEYVGIQVNGYNFFFKQGENIQFRGNMIPWKPEELVYSILK